MKTATHCVHPVKNHDPYGAISPPIYQTATFRQPNATEFGEYDYTRSGNPTRSLLERQLATLEDGDYACAFSSGMAAITALTRLLNQRDEIIAGDDLYGGTVRLLNQVLSRQGTIVHYADTTNLRAVQEVMSPRAKLILVETPSNPLLRISDIQALAELAHTVGAILAVDNSILSPCLQKPLLFGADVVVHSATKFLCGHSDVTAGALITKCQELFERLAFQQNAEGSGLSPFESWLLLRGMKTLALRVERQNASAQKIAQHLASNLRVERVFYPGLEAHPDYALQNKQAKGDGAVISFTTGDADFSKRLVEATQLFEIAVSFGSVGSVISLPCRMSHASIPAALRSRLSPPPDLVRLSVGIEDVDDLIEDLNQAFEAASRGTAERSKGEPLMSSACA